MRRRVVVANEYDVRRNLVRYRDGRYARHLLFGVNAIEDAGWSVRLTGEALPGRLGRGVFRLVVTNVRTAAAGWRADAVYATSSYGALLAGLLRVLVRRPRRVVTVVHGVPDALRRRPRVFGAMFWGHDALVFLSRADHAALAPALRPHQQAVWAPWGPSRTWAEAVAGATAEVPSGLPVQPFALVVGKSKRDWATLAAAHALRPFPLVVVAGADCPLQDGGGVMVHRPAAGRSEALPLAAVHRLYRAAHVVVLPLHEGSSLSGLTALGEALGAGGRTVISATRALQSFVQGYEQWVAPVPVRDPQALAHAVHRALAAGPPAAPPTAPAAEDLEDVVLRLLEPRPGRKGGRPDET